MRGTRQAMAQQPQASAGPACGVARQAMPGTQAEQAGRIRATWAPPPPIPHTALSTRAAPAASGAVGAPLAAPAPPPPSAARSASEYHSGASASRAGSANSASSARWRPSGVSQRSALALGVSSGHRRAVGLELLLSPVHQGAAGLELLRSCLTNETSVCALPRVAASPSSQGISCQASQHAPGSAVC